ncbi:MAG: membrane protein insertion efficiency factor YidD [Phycisphaerae bacterium]
MNAPPAPPPPTLATQPPAAPPRPGLGAWALIALVSAYQLVIRPLLVGQCKFHPSCSHYAIDALRQHGAWRGARLAARRLARCRPGTLGGWDPVPPATPRTSETRS